jgi:hypothetical protein
VERLPFLPWIRQFFSFLTGRCIDVFQAAELGFANMLSDQALAFGAAPPVHSSYACQGHIMDLCIIALLNLETLNILEHMTK